MYFLDALRLIAALAVLAWHWLGVQRFTGVWHGRTGVLMPVGHAVGAYGWLGVELFFMISGFVICMSCWGRSVGDFVTSRVIRLFPAYWVGVLLTAAVLYFSPHRWGHDPSRPTVTRVLTNLTMSHAPMGVSDIDPVYWTLWSELRFYVLFGVVVWFGVTYRRVLAFCGVWGFLSLLAPQAHWPLLDIVVQSQFSWYFIGGMVLFLIYRFGQNLLLWGMLGFCWLMAQNRIALIMTVNEYGARERLSWHVAALVVTVCFVVMAATALGAFNWIRWRWVASAGALTYPLYLVHQEIGFEVITRLSRRLSPYPTLAVVLALMLAAAWLIHRFVERPLAPLMKRGLVSSFAAMRRAENPADGVARSVG
ncbi:acyltransferase family protein [Streptomyces sp. NPDC002573]|uniref:acyltransferase family protein n=1 Tax=Streptomyces sp. NPDC002573 TaxID=3364651 RepID=UPI0036AF40C9